MEGTWNIKTDTFEEKRDIDTTETDTILEGEQAGDLRLCLEQLPKGEVDDTQKRIMFPQAGITNSDTNQGITVITNKSFGTSSELKRCSA